MKANTPRHESSAGRPVETISAHKSVQDHNPHATPNQRIVKNPALRFEAPGKPPTANMTPKQALSKGQSAMTGFEDINCGGHQKGASYGDPLKGASLMTRENRDMSEGLEKSRSHKLGGLVSMLDN